MLVGLRENAPEDLGGPQPVEECVAAQLSVERFPARRARFQMCGNPVQVVVAQRARSLFAEA
jgi:hypothetical protein